MVDGKQAYVITAYGARIPPNYHYAILVTDNHDYHKIYHLGSHNELNDAGGMVSEEDYETFKARGYQPFKFQKIDLTEEQIKKRSDLIRNKKYNKITFNCNDYVKVITGYPKLAQEDFIYLSLISMSALFLIREIYKRKKK